MQARRGGYRVLDDSATNVSSSQYCDLRVSILLLDPHALSRGCIAALLQRLDDNISVFGYPSVEDIDLLEKVDLVLWNLGSTRITDAVQRDALHLLRSKLPEVPLAICSKLDDAKHANDTIGLGVRGYIPATVSSEVIVAALRLIAGGGLYVGPLSTEANATETANATPTTIDPRNGLADRGLTKREKDILSLLIQGKPNKLIAYELQISENTVKVHVRRIMKKMRFINRTEAAGLFACFGKAPSRKVGVKTTNNIDSSIVINATSLG